MIDAYAVGTTMSLDIKGMSTSLRAVAAQFQRLQELGSALAENGRGTTKAIADIARISRPAAAVVRQMADAMKALNEQAKAAMSSTASLGLQEQKLANMRQRETERQADRQARLARQQQSDTDRATRQQEASARSAARAQAQAAAATERSWSSAYQAMRMRAARVGGALASPLNGGLAGVGAFATGHYVRDAVNNASEFDRLGMNMQLYRGSGEDRAKMERAATDVSGRHADSSRLDMMKAFDETMSIVGPEHSIDMGDMLADARTRLSQVYHGHMPENAMQQLLKFAEESGRVYDKDGHFDKERVGAAFNIAIEAARRSGGMVQLPALVDAMRYSGGMARTMSDDALMQYLEGQVATMKGAGAGTALESMSSGLLRGKINMDQFRMLDMTGNLDKSKMHRIRGTNQYHLDNGAFKSMGALMDNPFQWQLDQISKYAKAKGITEEEAIYQMFPRERSRRGGTQLLNNMQMSKNNFEAQRASLLGPNNQNARRDEAGNIMRDAQGRAMIDHNKANGYQAAVIRSEVQGNQIDQVSKAFENLSTVLGREIFKSGQGVLGDLIRNLDSMSDWAGKNGTTLRETISSLAGVAGLAGLGSAFFLLRGAFVPLMMGGVIMKGLEHFTGKQGLPALTATLEELFGVLDKIPSWMKSMVVGAVLGGRLGGARGAMVGAGIGLGASQYGNDKGDTDFQRNMTDVWAQAYKDQLVRQGYSPEKAEFYSRHSTLGALMGVPEQEGLRDASGMPLSNMPLYPPGYGPYGKLPAVPPGVQEQGRTMGFPPGTPADNADAAKPQQHSYVPSGEGGFRVQQPVILSLNDREMGRAMITVLGREASRPSAGYSGFDSRQSPMQPGAMPALG